MSSFESIEINLGFVLFFWSNLKNQIWSTRYCHLDPSCELVELQ